MDDSNKSIHNYLDSLNEKEKQALDIAKTALKSSFSLHKSIGYLKWKETHKDIPKK